MNETNMKSDYRTSQKNICPVCCGPLRIQDIGAEVQEVLLWCPASACRYGDITENHAASTLAAYGVQAPTEEAAFQILETKIAAMPERPAPDSEDEDGGSER